MKTKKIKVNYFLAIVVGGVVKQNYYANSLDVIPDLKKDYPGCEVEVYDVSKYGFDFGDAPVIKVEGGRISSIRCRETGEIWQSAKECCKALGMPLKTLYTAIRRGSRIFGKHFEYYKLHQ